MQFLKTDFPKVPFTNCSDLFIEMAKLGGRLVSLHIMKSEELNNPTTKFQGEGDNEVKNPFYSEETNRVYINKTQYFEGIDKKMWEYQIGGYQVLSKWLKDRKGRKLIIEDIKHYCRVATALRLTLETQEEIDKLYPEIEQSFIENEEDEVKITSDFSNSQPN